MFLPGVQLLTWKQADRSIGWDTLLMIGGVTSLGSASLQAGLANWLVDLTLRGVADWSIVLALVAISAFTVVVHLALPIGPVVNAVVHSANRLACCLSGGKPGAIRSTSRVYRFLCVPCYRWMPYA